jgi:hypothetical protein
MFRDQKKRSGLLFLLIGHLSYVDLFAGIESFHQQMKTYLFSKKKEFKVI